GEHGALPRALTAVPEPPWAGPAGGFGQAPGVPRLVHGLPVLAEVLEHLDQGPLPEPPGAARSDLQSPAAPLDQAGLFQGAFDLLQPADVAHGLLPEGPPERVLVHVLDGSPRVVAPERLVKFLVVVEPFQRVDGSGQRARFLA